MFTLLFSFEYWITEIVTEIIIFKNKGHRKSGENHVYPEGKNKGSAAYKYELVQLTSQVNYYFLHHLNT